MPVRYAARRSFAVGSAVLLLACQEHALSPATLAIRENTRYVNTTVDLAFQRSHCGPGAICPLRSAIIQAEGGGVVRACYDPLEVDGASGCPPGALPLRMSDPGYDSRSKRWVFRLAVPLGSLEIVTGSVTIDFARDLGAWDGPEDNRIVIESSSPGLASGLVLEASDNRLAGFEIRGQFDVAGLDVRLGSSNNVLGPGLVFADIRPGGGVLIRHQGTRSNRLIGSWCGITGDGQQEAPVTGDCVRLAQGAQGNLVGGAAEREGNILAGSMAGAGVRVLGGLGADTRDNRIEGNWIGMDISGRAVGAMAGVSVTEQAANTTIVGNTIGGHRLDGITVSGPLFGTRIENNRIGALEDGSPRGNAGWGIRLRSGVVRSVIRGNRIAHNAAGGVVLGGAMTRLNSLSENRITANGGRAVVLVGGANDGLASPRLLQVTETSVIGQGCAGCMLEVFSDPGTEADSFEGRARADPATGLFVFEKASTAYRHGRVTVTATDANGNTSALSEHIVLPGRPAATPTVTPTRPSNLDYRLCLPRLDRSWAR